MVGETTAEILNRGVSVVVAVHFAAVGIGSCPVPNASTVVGSGV